MEGDKTTNKIKQKAQAKCIIVPNRFLIYWDVGQFRSRSRSRVWVLGCSTVQEAEPVPGVGVGM